MSRAFSQLDVKRTLIETSLTLMFTDIDDDTCKTLILTALNNDIGPMKNNLKLNWDDIKTLSNNIRNLESWNEDLRLKSCPKIY